ncbi:hypothetical protein SUDANB15_05458 [Streptomyces sp. enrichment culture]
MCRSSPGSAEIPVPAADVPAGSRRPTASAGGPGPVRAPSTRVRRGRGGGDGPRRRRPGTGHGRRCPCAAGGTARSRGRPVPGSRRAAGRPGPAAGADRAEVLVAVPGTDARVEQRVVEVPLAQHRLAAGGEGAARGGAFGETGADETGRGPGGLRLAQPGALAGRVRRTRLPQGAASSRAARSTSTARNPTGGDSGTSTPSRVRRKANRGTRTRASGAGHRPRRRGDDSEIRTSPTLPVRPLIVGTTATVAERGWSPFRSMREPARRGDAHGAGGVCSSPGPVRVPRALRPLTGENRHAAPVVRIRAGQEAARQGVARGDGPARPGARGASAGPRPRRRGPLAVPPTLMA